MPWQVGRGRQLQRPGDELHLEALARARAQRAELPCWERREPEHAPCYEVVPDPVVGGTDVEDSSRPGPQLAVPQAR